MATELNGVHSAAQTVFDTVMRLIESDPHHWNRKTCQSCLAVSAMLNRDFGCCNPKVVMISSGGVRNAAVQNNEYHDKIRAMAPIDQLVYLIKEREKIRLARSEDIAPPWTEDAILAQYRFCNIRRMDDKVSRWIYQNWYYPNKGNKNMLLAATIARHFNNTEVLEAIGFPDPWEPKKVHNILQARSDQGLKNYNPAYVISGNHGPQDRDKQAKVHQTVYIVCDPVARNPLQIDTSSMSRTWGGLLAYTGFSSFIAGQVVADLRWAVPGKWEDKHTWAPIGTGSCLGMNYLKQRPRDYKPTQAQFVSELLEVIAAIKPKLPKSITSRLEAMDYQSCLCEYGKYAKTLLGEGRPKQKYDAKGVALVYGSQPGVSGEENE